MSCKQTHHCIFAHSCKPNRAQHIVMFSERIGSRRTSYAVEAIEALLPWNLEPILDARRRRQEPASQIDSP